ncbi:MAG: tetratricopeptide repeat protein [Syntrophales bacterium]|nr:tetratricopeptide repeat protein [Syntrophales bacterium]MDD5641552.1 tetratricopeptide repeat protein [Syntrophales bacterium]
MATSRTRKPAKTGHDHLFAPLNVLVVDDVPGIRRMLRQMLIMLGVNGRIGEANDGMEAWDILQDIPYDVVICDINMPRMNGLELLRVMRANPRYETTPFLMITGEVSEEVVAVAAESEVDSYLLKPFQAAALESRLLEIIRKKLRPSGGEALFLQAQKLKVAGQPDQALPILEKLLRPPYKKQAKTLNLAGECLQALGDHLQAEECYTQAKEVNPKYLKTYQNLAILMESNDRLDEARQYLEEAQALSPLNTERLFHLGQICLQTGKQEQAQDYLQKCLSNGHCFANSHRQEAAEIYLEAGMSAEAEKLFSESLKEDPQNIQLYNRLGIALRQQQKHQEALDCYHKALKVDPKSEKIYYNLGILYFDLGEREKSLDAFRQALKIRPNFPEAKDFLREHFLNQNST